MGTKTGSGPISVGRDAQLIVQGAAGQVDLGHVTNFKHSRKTVEIDVLRMDGTAVFASLPRHAEGSFEATRSNPALEEFFSAEAALWHASGDYSTCTLYFYVNEANGSRTVYQFTGAAIVLDDAGTWEGENAVKMTVTFKASKLAVN
ncbi:hypothetical protein [Teichococcus deserti]|uniref:hypothetical protein n=1 Tax=Teichococcus deserti TaxID=1817963 RepID=UPI0009756FB8|nr:hypothetical protein [Pseudoroseomonas deserti]